MKSQKLGVPLTLFFLLYMVLPSYFAVELSESLPLFTVSRLLLLFLVIVYVCRTNGKIKLRLSADDRVQGSLVGYFVLLVAANIAYLLVTSAALKEILTIICEELLVVWVVTQVIDRREKLLRALELLVYASGVVAIISIVGSLTGINLFAYLNTVDREMLISNYLRLGLMRAEAGFGHPVYYGLYTAVMIPIAMYFVEFGKKKTLYMVCLILNLLGLLLSNSRGSMVAFLVVALLMVISKRKSQLRKYQNYFIVAVIMVVAILAVSDKVRSFVWEIVQSVLAIIFPDVSMSENYGENASGMASRFKQFSGMYWTLTHNPLFGMGADAHKRGVLKYIWGNGIWIEAKTFDNALVSIFCQFGIVGTAGYAFLYHAVLKKLFGRRRRRDDLSDMFGYVYLTFLIGFFTVSSLHHVFWLITALLVCYINICEKESAKSMQENRSACVAARGEV